MAAKEKIIGIVLVVLGVFPFLLNIKAIGGVLGQYTWLLPGETVYQIALIILGVLLILGKKRKKAVRRLYPYREE